MDSVMNAHAINTRPSFLPRGGAGKIDYFACFKPSMLEL